MTLKCSQAVNNDRDNVLHSAENSLEIPINN